MKKRTIVLERHNYAPELNRLVWLDRKTLQTVASWPAHSCTNVKQALLPFTRRHAAPFRHVRIIKHYPVGHILYKPWGDVVRNGRVMTYREVKVAMQVERAKLAPSGWLTVEIRLIEG